jgi:hypothetical protein
MLLRWAGCRDKHHAKYRSIYNEHVGLKLLWWLMIPVISINDLSTSLLMCDFTFPPFLFQGCVNICYTGLEDSILL